VNIADFELLIVIGLLEKQLMTNTIESIYDRFVDKVSEGRKNSQGNR
jgi:ClpP class serine protease